MSAFEKALVACDEAITHLQKSAPSREDELAFLIRLREDPDKRIQRIFRNLIVNGITASEFVKELRGVWHLSEASKLLPLSRRVVRKQEKLETELSKQLAKLTVSKEIPPQDKAGILKRASEFFAKAKPIPTLDVFIQSLELFQLTDVRSDHGGSRARTVFMRLIS